VSGHALAIPRKGRGRACVRLSIRIRGGELPTGKFAVVGGTRDAAKLRGEAAFRFQVVGDRPATIIGNLRAGLGRARGLPRACR
jgi:hypothetical protein